MSKNHSERDNVHGGTDKQKARIENLNRKINRAEKANKVSNRANNQQGNGRNR